MSTMGANALVAAASQSGGGGAKSSGGGGDILAGIANAAEAIGNIYHQSKSRKLQKKQIKEIKRQTFADLLNQALKRQSEESQFGRELASTQAARQAAALQDIAAGFRQSLIS